VKTREKVLRYGRATIDYVSPENTALAQEIAEVNPYRWKSFYQDAETGFYHISSRYYDPETGVFLDADDPEDIVANATVIGGLDRNSITFGNHLAVEPNGFDIFPTNELATDVTYDPDAGRSWWEKNGFNVLLTVFQGL